MYPVVYKSSYGVTTYIDISYLHVYSYSPPGTGGYHASEGDTNVTADDKVVYAAPVQAVNIPHQAAASGEQYAVSTKTVSKTSEEQPPSGQYNGATHDTKKDTQGVSSSNSGLMIYIQGVSILNVHTYIYTYIPHAYVFTSILVISYLQYV